VRNAVIGLMPVARRAELINEHGIEKISAVLTPLINQFKWSDWQRAYDFANRLNRRK
jgi:hypothetical protein